MSVATMSGVIIGIGGPNKTGDGRIVQCCIALTKEFGLVRLFAGFECTMRNVSLWEEVTISAVKTSKDVREESWKLIAIEVVGKIDSSPEKRTILNGTVLRCGSEDPIEYQNARRLSIAVAVPVKQTLSVTMKSQDSEDADNGFVAQCNQSNRAYIDWESCSGSRHNLPCVGHEVFEGLRKNPSAPMRVFENMHTHDQDWDKWLVLGNTQHRNVWVIVHVHRLKKTIPERIQQSSWITDGDPSGWPYLRKEVMRAKAAAFNPQKTLFTMFDMTAT